MYRTTSSWFCLPFWVVIRLLPIAFSLSKLQSNWACQGHPSAAKRMGGEVDDVKGRMKEKLLLLGGKTQKAEKEPSAGKCLFPQV